MTTKEKKAILQGDMAVITDIQRYSVHDGPGIRSLVFFKGCPLRCKWCHNPETHSPIPELLFNKDLCIGCGACLKVCPNNAISIQGNLPSTDRTRCQSCGRCTEGCYSGARTISGHILNLKDVYETVIRDVDFYRHTDGGVTLSGGEVLMQPVFASRLLEMLKKSEIHTAIETCGYGQWDVFESILRYTDLILFDIKHSDEVMHKKYTGQSNRLIIENLYKAAALVKDIIIRVPLIPTVNNSPEVLHQIGAIARQVHAQALHILPFHQIGSTKWDASGREYLFRDYPELGKMEVDALLKETGELGLPVVYGGN